MYDVFDVPTDSVVFCICRSKLPVVCCGIELLPSMGYAYLLRADIVMRREPPDYDAAVEAMEAAIRYGRNDAATRVNYGTILLLAEELWPSSSWWICQGMNRSSARQTLARAQSMNRSDPTVQQVTARINELQ